MREIICYYLEGCPYSMNSKRILESLVPLIKAKVNIFKIDNEHDKEHVKKKYKSYLNNHKTFPMIFMKTSNDKLYFIGGNDTLLKILNNNDYNLNNLEKKMKKYLST